jgi:MFS family permease
MRIDNLREFSLYSVVGIVALMPLLVLPAMIGVLVDGIAMAESFAGWVAFASFIGGAVISLILAFRMHHIDLRRLATLALAFAAVADAVSAFAAAPTAAFLIVRFCAGLGTGAAYVAAVSAFARFDNCDQGYGVFITLQFIVSGLGLYLLPVFSASLGVTGMYLSFVGFDVLALLVARYLPGRAEIDPADAERPTELAILFAAATILAMLGFGVFEAANTAQFTYIERAGVALDLSTQQVGIALMIASMIGIPGAFAIVLVGQRFGTIGPLVFGIGVAGRGLLPGFLVGVLPALHPDPVGGDRSQRQRRCRWIGDVDPRRSGRPGAGRVGGWRRRLPSRIRAVDWTVPDRDGGDGDLGMEGAQGASEVGP